MERNLIASVLWLFRHSVMFDSLQPHRLQHTRLPFTLLSISWSFLRLKSLELMMPFNYLILCCPLLFLPSIFPTIRVFSNESVLHIRWPKYWRFSFSISLSNDYSGFLSFSIDWFDLLAVQGILASLFQHQSSKASIAWHSSFLLSSSHICTWLLGKP